MIEIGSGDGFRTLEEVLKPDPRYRYFVRVNWKTGETSKHELADFHAELEALGLSDGAPDGVRVEFDNARNLMLYSWFVYRFAQPAELQALRTLEFALREELEGARARRRPAMLRDLVARALDERWNRHRLAGRLTKLRVDSSRAPITGVRPEGASADLGAYLDEFVKSVSGYRNRLAHGGRYLAPGLYVLGMCQILIEELYREFGRDGTG